MLAAEIAIGVVAVVVVAAAVGDAANVESAAIVATEGDRQ